MDPSRLGSRTIFAGDPRYNDPAHKAPVMSPELSKLVEKIRAEQKSEPRSRAFITAEEVGVLVEVLGDLCSIVCVRFGGM